MQIIPGIDFSTESTRISIPLKTVNLQYIGYIRDVRTVCNIKNATHDVGHDRQLAKPTNLTNNVIKPATICSQNACRFSVQLS